MPKLYDYDPVKERKILVGEIGESKPDTLFLTKTNKHFMRVVNGYGIQESAFDKLEEKGIEHIVIHNTDTDSRLTADVQTWKMNGKRANYGHGRQVFLSVAYMKLLKSA